MTGLIVDKATGTSINDAVVWLMRPSGSWPPVDTQDLANEEHYTLTAEAGTYRIMVTEPTSALDQRVPARWPWLERRVNGTTPATTAPTVEVAADATVDLDITMTRAGVINGVVLGGTGRPGARVSELQARTVPGNVNVGMTLLYAPASVRTPTFRIFATKAFGPVRVRVVALDPGGRPLPWQSDTFTIAPEQVVKDVRVAPLPTAPPSPSGRPSTAAQAAGSDASLAETGSGTALTAVALALLLMGCGCALLALELAPPRASRGSGPRP